MRTLEECIERVDIFAQYVFDKKANSTAEFKKLRELASLYKDAKGSSVEDLQRNIFAGACRDYVNNGGHLPYEVFLLFNKMVNKGCKRTISVEDRSGDNFKYQVTVADVPDDSNYQPPRTQSAFDSLQDARLFANAKVAESKRGDFEPVADGQNRQ